LRNSVYTMNDSFVRQLHQRQFGDVAVVAGVVGETCTKACDAFTSDPESRSTLTFVWPPDQTRGHTYKCNEQLFPLIFRHCGRLRDLLGCGSCEDVADVEQAFVAPYVLDEQKKCLVARASHIRCNAPTPTNVRRACVCQRQD